MSTLIRQLVRLICATFAVASSLRLVGQPRFRARTITLAKNLHVVLE